MGVILWFAKMFLKVLKPFIKMAIFGSIFESLLDIFGDLDLGEDPTEAPASEEETE